MILAFWAAYSATRCESVPTTVSGSSTAHLRFSTIVASLCTAPLEFVFQLFDLDMANLDAKFFEYFRAGLMCRWFIFALSASKPSCSTIPLSPRATRRRASCALPASIGSSMGPSPDGSRR